MSSSTMRIAAIGVLTIALSAAAASDVWPQMATPSARTLSLARSYIGRARGFEAPFFNPANLGLPDRPGWSLGVVGMRGNLANNSLSYGQVQDLYGEFLTDEKKSELLAEIREDNPDRMFEAAVDADAQALGVSIWRVAFGLSAVGAGVARVSPDIVELILFGNVGEDGSGKDFDLQGSDGLGWVASSAYISYAHPFTLQATDHLGMEFAIGATVRYVAGNWLGQLKDRNSSLTNSPLQLTFDAEALASNDLFSGSGWGVDLGGVAHWSGITAGIAVENLFRDLSWDAEVFELTRLTAQADFDSTTSSDTTLAFAELSSDEQQAVNDFLAQADLPTRLRLGGVYELRAGLSLSADYEEVIGGMLRTGWDRSLSVGAEFRPITVLPLRLGVATSFDDVAFAGGLGIYAGPAHLDLAIGRKGLAGGDGLVGALSISVWPGAGY